MRSPFHFLDPYSNDESAKFFGREEEVNELFNLIKKSKLLILHGPEGSGKTSLINAGLTQRMDVTDWLPVFVSRKNNINQSFKKEISNKLGKDPGKKRITDAILCIFKRHVKNVYLIFDQLEELIIHGSEEEKKKFITDISLILDANLPCKIIWVINDAFVLELLELTKVTSGLVNRTMRLDNPGQDQAKEIVVSLAKALNIHFEKPEQDINAIISKLNLKNRVPLKRIQSLFERIYRSAAKSNAIPEIHSKTFFQNLESQNLPSIKILTEDLKAILDEKNSLEHLFKEKIVNIKKTLSEKHTRLPDNSVEMVLELMVDRSGNRVLLNYTRENDKIVFPQYRSEFQSEFPLVDICNMLYQERIIRIEQDTLALSHDLMVKMLEKEELNEVVSEEILESSLESDIKDQIQNALNDLQTKKVFPDEVKVALFESILNRPDIELEPRIISFIKDCRIHVQRLQRDRFLYQMHQAEDSIRQSYQRKQWIIIISSTILTLTLGVIFFFFGSGNNNGPSTGEGIKTSMGQESIVYERDSLIMVLENFQREQANVIIAEVDDLIGRAYQMEDRGYLDARRELLQEAKLKLSAFRNNPKLAEKIAQVDRLLN